MLCLTLGGCLLGPRETYDLTAGLTHKRNSYYLQLAGDCEYPEGTGVLVRNEATQKVLWDAKLHAGKTSEPLMLGKSSQVLSEKVPFEGLENADSIWILVSDNVTSWSNYFKPRSIGSTLNGGNFFEGKDISLADLNKAADEAGTCN
jgi:hypothetical protein